jgi:arsenate reductase
MALPDSDQALVLLHNPRCSKSRKARELLEARGASFELREYLVQPLCVEELQSLAARLGRPLSEWIRKREPVFSELGCSAESSETELLAAVAANPILMERPILVRGRRAVVGRPPEDVLALLD